MSDDAYDVRARATRELKEHEERIRVHEAKVAEHKTAASELRTFLSVLDKLSANGASPVPVNRDADDERPEAELRAAMMEAPTHLDGFKIALQAKGAELSAGDGAKLMLDMGYPFDKESDRLAASLRGVLAGKHEDDPEIVKIGRGRFALRAWEREGRLFDD